MSFLRKQSVHRLKLVDYHNPILRHPAETVSFPLSPSDKQLIKDMQHSIQEKQLKKAHAPWKSAAGMAAPQWGINKRIFLYATDKKDEFEVIINPSYEPVDDISTGLVMQERHWESCFSIPCKAGHVIRYLHIRVAYQNEKGETIIKQLFGWPARIWQHENDHLNGFLYDDPRTGKCSEVRDYFG